MYRLIPTVLVAAIVVTYTAPASAFNMRKALQAVENLTQWSVMADHCGEGNSASDIRQTTILVIEDAEISNSERMKLTNEVGYWVKTINRNFRTGGLHVDTACPIWDANGQREVKKEMARLQAQLG